MQNHQTTKSKLAYFLVKKKLKEENTKNYTIIFDVSYTEWSEYFLKIDKSNVIQSWGYGEAKAKSEGWVAKRAFILQSGRPIAMFQVLVKSFFFLKIVRLNLGPLWIEKPTTEELIYSLRVIKKIFCLRKLKILFFAPNISNTIEYKKILRTLGFYKRRAISLNSGLVDLSKSIEELRAGLRSNWRRQLKSAEKKNLRFNISANPKDFEWLMSKYEVYQSEKKFHGSPIKLIKSLYENKLSSNDVWVFLVLNDNEIVASLLVVSYITGCIPIVSWISDKGRELNAGNFLLWNSIIYAKSKGCNWFEQGGIDDNNAEVARFKRGIPCAEYNMIGEYISGI